MLLLIDGTVGSDLPAFLLRLQEETMPCTIQPYDAWHHQHNTCPDHHHERPSGIILMRVLPEIAYKRLQQSGIQNPITLDDIKQIYTQKEEFFITNKNNLQDLKNLPVLVLNGNIDFQTDFSQFYNHLFYIRRFINQIQEHKDIAMGIHKEKAPQRKCC